MGTAKSIKWSSYIGWHIDVHSFKGDTTGSVDAAGRLYACRWNYGYLKFLFLNDYK